MKLVIPYWTPHHNMLIFSYLYFCEENQLEFKIEVDSKISANGAVLHLNTKTLFFDYSDSSEFIDNPKKYNFYFKRSLLLRDKNQNVHPLNFQVNYSYKALYFLTQLGVKQLIHKDNRIEIVRALDYFNMFTNSSHNAMDIRMFPESVDDANGRVLFHTRLWNPDNHKDADEKERRALQNEFRIGACRIIKNNFKNASVGLFPDDLAIKLAPDLLLDVRKISKKEYFGLLKQFDIGIADDGLKDTPGWKIGEYLLFGKAVITTPLSVKLHDFKESVNYEMVSNRIAYHELPDKIQGLLTNKKYLDMASANKAWSDRYIHPKNYIKHIFSIMEKSL
jgi:hypothetical protein